MKRALKVTVAASKCGGRAIPGCFTARIWHPDGSMTQLPAHRNPFEARRAAAKFLKRKTMKRAPFKWKGKVNKVKVGVPIPIVFGVVRDPKMEQPKKRKRLSQMSPRMKILRRIYLRLKAAFLLANPACQFPGCLKRSVDVHHMKGRGKWYLVVEFFMAICRAHHNWIHTHPNKAREMGYLLKP